MPPQSDFILRGSIKTRDGALLLRYLFKLPNGELPQRSLDFLHNIAYEYEGYLKNTRGASLLAKYEASTDPRRHMHFPTADVYIEYSAYRRSRSVTQYVAITLDVVETSEGVTTNFRRFCHIFDGESGLLVPDAELIGRKKRASNGAFIALTDRGVHYYLNTFVPNGVRLRRSELERYIIPAE